MRGSTPDARTHRWREKRTIVGNVGAGIGGNDADSINLSNSILADNRAELSDRVDNCWGIFIVDLGNYFTDADETICPPGFGTITGLDPILADNGGPTPTHALLPGSAAIDAAGEACPAVDQRGVIRPQDGDGDGVARCDAGAVEYEHDNGQPGPLSRSPR